MNEAQKTYAFGPKASPRHPKTGKKVEEVPKPGYCSSTSSDENNRFIAPTEVEKVKLETQAPATKKLGAKRQVTSKINTGLNKSGPVVAAASAQLKRPASATLAQSSSRSASLTPRKTPPKNKNVSEL